MFFTCISVDDMCEIGDKTSDGLYRAKCVPSVVKAIKMQSSLMFFTIAPRSFTVSILNYPAVCSLAGVAL